MLSDRAQAMSDAMERSFKRIQAEHAAAGTQASMQQVLAASVASLGKFMIGEIKALEDRLAELEKAPLAFKGVHEEGRLYERNSVVTREGSMWVALRATQQRPGDGGDGWQLAVKRGRDAR